MNSQTSNAFVLASWFALVVGMLAYLIGLWNAEMLLNEKGYYFIILMYALFAAITVQKNVRDRMEGIPISNMYSGISWFSVLVSVVLLSVGLFNSALALSEKGFFAMAFMLCLFAAIAVGKNTRDLDSEIKPAISEQ